MLVTHCDAELLKSGERVLSSERKHAISGARGGGTTASSSSTSKISSGFEFGRASEIGGGPLPDTGASSRCELVAA